MKKEKNDDSKKEKPINRIFDEDGRRIGYIEKFTGQRLPTPAPKYVTDRIPINKKLSGSEKMQQNRIIFTRRKNDRRK